MFSALPCFLPSHHFSSYVDEAGLQISVQLEMTLVSSPGIIFPSARAIGMSHHAQQYFLKY